MSLDLLFSPESVAVVGASRDPSAVGHRILQGLLRSGFGGPVYPVNPEARHVASVKAYPSVHEIGAPVQLAVVAVPAESVPEAVEDCREAGVEALVVISAGFAEMGEEGREREEALLEAVREGGMRMLGPNCLGLIHTAPDVRLNASFAPLLPSYGPVSLCSQSGALGIAVLAQAVELQLGLGHFASVGNKADVAEDDLLEFWGEDQESQILLFYLESFKRPRRFGRLARSICRKKPVVVVKGGRSAAGRRAAGSHTAALTGGEDAVNAFFRQTGLIRASTLEDMFGLARALAEQPLPPGRRFAVVTNAGGPGILCADGLEAGGLSVVPLEEETRKELQEILPPEAATGNPVDMIASAGTEEYRNTVKTVLKAREVDGVVVIHTPVGMVDQGRVEEAILEGMQEARSQDEATRDKPVYASVVGGEEQIYLLSGASRSPSEPTRHEDHGAIPAFPFPEEVGRVAGSLVEHGEWREEDRGDFPDFPDQEMEAARGICLSALEERGDGWLSVQESREILSLAGIPVARGGVARDADRAVELARETGFPVVAKVAATQVPHKTEHGGVVLGLGSEAEVRKACGDIRERMEAEGLEGEMEGFLIQEQFGDAAEVLMGMSEDPVFGPILVFGLGGIHVEILEDVAFGVTPLCRNDAGRMIREVRGFQLLEGYRGHPPGDVEALEEVLLRLSRLAESVEELREMDLNPVMALEPGDGCRVVDARFAIRRS